MNKITALGEVNITPEYLGELIDAHGDEKQRLYELYEAYKGDVAICTRDFNDETLINVRLANDFRGEIVDQIMGYLVGRPITYSYDAEQKNVKDAIEAFKKENNIELLDINIVKMMSICGKAYRLLYLQDARVYLINCNPWNIIPIWHSSGEWLEAAIRYIPVYDSEGNEIYRAEVYTKKDVTVYQEEDSQYKVIEATVEHGFDEVPIVPIENNEEELGDFEKTASLIDAYDTALSDSQNEIQEFREAYQVFENCEITPEIKREAKKSGAYNLPRNGKVQYLTKDLNPEFLKQHLDRLEENIYRFSKTVNMSDEKFSGDSQSGVARKWKLLTLEFRATIKQLKLIEAFRWQFELIQYIWNAKGIPFEFLDMEFKFSRNIPLELKESAEIASSLKGIVSDETLLETLPIVDDVKKEKQRIEDEREEMPELEDEDETELE